MGQHSQYFHLFPSNFSSFPAEKVWVSIQVPLHRSKRDWLNITISVFPQCSRTPRSCFSQILWHWRMHGWLLPRTQPSSQATRHFSFKQECRTNFNPSMLVCPASFNLCIQSIGSLSVFQANRYCVPTQGKSPFSSKKNHFKLIQWKIDVRREIQFLSFKINEQIRWMNTNTNGSSQIEWRECMSGLVVNWGTRILITEFMGVQSLCLKHTDYPRDLVKMHILFQ